MRVTRKQISTKAKLGLALLLLIGISSCKTEELDVVNNSNTIISEYLNLPETPFSYEDLSIPSFLDVSRIQTHDNTPNYNAITNHGATLGRVLFYDKNLSQNNQISCASCHIQANGFSDTLVASIGFEGGLTARHSMGLSNARYRTNGKFFWDERASTLEEQVLMPIQDPVEMGMELPDLEAKLQLQEYYPILFQQAFGDSLVTSEKISFALAQFVRSLMSFNSKFDQGRAIHEIDEPFSNFTDQENLGKDIFHSNTKGLCSGCHFTEAMITEESRNNGLSREFDDIGVEGTTGNPFDRYKFKAPSLRNIAVRPPYMHNGAYPTLKSVIQGYSTGITWSPTLDAHLMKPGNQEAIKFNLTREEVDALEAFLHTLTDDEFLNNEMYEDPFK